MSLPQYKFVMRIYISRDTHVSVRILGISEHGLEYNHILIAKLIIYANTE